VKPSARGHARSSQISQPRPAGQPQSGDHESAATESGTPPCEGRDGRYGRWHPELAALVCGAGGRRLGDLGFDAARRDRLAGQWAGNWLRSVTK
jgi:hypothetical protein